MSGGLDLDLLGTRFSVHAPGRWVAFLRYLWGDLEQPARGDGLRVRIDDEDGATQLELPGEPPLPFEDPWALVEVVRYWLVEHAVQRVEGVLPFHAAALTRGSSAVLFAGPSGAGKTTLSVELAARGWSLAGDDIAPLDLATGRVHPFPKPLSLRRPDMWPALSTRSPDHALPPPPPWPPPPAKGPLLVPAALFARQREPFRPTNLLFISYAPDEPSESEALSPGQATALCVEYARGSGPTSVAALARLCRAAPAARIRYPSSASALELIEQALEKDEKTR